MGGLVGNTTLMSPNKPLKTLMPLLQLGEQLHIGKETVMGLGRYRLSAHEKRPRKPLNAALPDRLKTFGQSFNPTPQQTDSAFHAPNFLATHHASA